MTWVAIGIGIFVVVEALALLLALGICAAAGNADRWVESALRELQRHASGTPPS